MMSFEYWLTKQKKRNDPVGDLAKDFFRANTERMPFSDIIPSINELTPKVLKRLHACRGAIDAFNEARIEYKAMLASESS